MIVARTSTLGPAYNSHGVFRVVVVSDYLVCAPRLIGRPAQGPPPAIRSWIAVALKQPSNISKSSQWMVGAVSAGL